MNKNLNRVLEHAEKAVLHATEQPPEEGRETIRAAIRDLLAHVKEDSRGLVSYALGYCWYNMPGENYERETETEKWLKHALEVAPDNQYARLYLGHLFFDTMRYKEARQLFEVIPSDYFRRNYGQAWRDLKIRELILCCDIYENPKYINVDAFGIVRDEYLAVPEEESAIPSELITALVWVVENGEVTQSLVTAVKWCIAWLNSAELDRTFSDEIRKLCAIIPKSLI